VSCLGRTALGQPCAAPVLYTVSGHIAVRDACGLHMPQIVRWTLRANLGLPTLRVTTSVPPQDGDTVSVKQIMKNLSPAQQRILDAARAGRTRPYAGRAKPAIDRLVALDLVTADYRTRTRTRGDGTQWSITVTPVRDTEPEEQEHE
jgi:hypothetical protein